MNMQEIRNHILSITTTEDLRKLNEIIRLRWKQLDTLATFRLNISDKVSFNSKDGLKTGTITKINRTTVRVFTDDKMNWTVSPNLIKIIT